VRRGEIHVVDFGPTRGAGLGDSRPAVIVSNDSANTTAVRLGAGAITVVPVTPNVDRVFPFQVLLRAEATGLARDAKAQAEQVRTVSVERIGRRVGELGADQMRLLDQALRIHLAL
jgi:mRNA interferase MazF